MRVRFISGAFLAAVLATAACGGMMTSPTSMMMTSMQSAGLGVGTWSSTSAMPSQQGMCGGFKWTITSITTTSVSGTFSATCNGNVPMSGNGSATATLTGGTINWTATAMASVPGNNNCAVSLSGTMEATATGFRVPYSGMTCLGPVSGTEMMGKG